MEGTGRVRIAGVLAVTSSTILTLIVFGFTLLALAISADSREGGYCESIDHPGECESEGLIALVGFGLTGLGAWGVAAGVGFLRRRRWARRATMVVFSAWAVLITAAFAAAALGPGGLDWAGALLWLLIMGLLVTIGVLASRAR